jgi:hypothetical protein
MRHLLLTILLLACGRNESQPSTVSLSDVQAKRDSIMESFDTNSIERCDWLTFAALVDAFTAKKVNIYAVEKTPGIWHRHMQTCYPEHSQSETSRDGYLSALHAFKTRGDTAAVQRILSAVRPLEYRTGPGPLGVAGIAPLVPIMRKMAGAYLVDESDDALPDAFQKVTQGFRPHLIASYIWLSGRVHGSITNAGRDVLKTFVRENPNSPFFRALRSRFDDGDQTEALELLDRMPHEDAPFGWGSCPWQVYYAISVAVMEGR